MAVNQQTGDLAVCSRTSLFVTDLNGALLAHFSSLAPSAWSGVQHSLPPSSHHRGHSQHHSYHARHGSHPHSHSHHHAATSHAEAAIEPFTSIAIAQAAGYEMADSCALIVTGHSNGVVRVWHVVLTANLRLQAQKNPRGGAGGSGTATPSGTGSATHSPAHTPTLHSRSLRRP